MRPPSGVFCVSADNDPSINHQNSIPMMLNEAMHRLLTPRSTTSCFRMYSYFDGAYCEHKQFRGCAR